MDEHKKYIPALSANWLTPYYDALMRRGMREELIKCRLIQQADIQAGMAVLDMGCGTGTLTLMIKQDYPEAIVKGLDGDPQILKIAREKANKADLEIEFTEGLADRLPYPDGAFQRVLTSLMTHHLDHTQKLAAFREVYRVLAPGGELHLLDFGLPHSVFGRLLAPILRNMEEAGDNLRGNLPEMIRSAGFSSMLETEHFTTLFGDLTVLKATR